MANKKISQLTPAGPLTGSEPLPIVQGGVTVKATTYDVSSIVGSPIFQPDIVTYLGTTAAGISLDLYANGGYNTFFSRQIVAPNLVTMYGVITLIGSNNGSYGNSNSPLQIISMPLLEEIGILSMPTSYSIDIEYWEDLETIDFDSLKTVYGKIYISDNPSLINLNFSSLERLDNSLSFYNLSLLEVFSIPNLTTFDSSFQVTGCGLNQTSVDSILGRLANVINLSNQTVDLSGGTSAAPSVTGAGYVATLTANGCTVTTN